MKAAIEIKRLKHGMTYFKIELKIKLRAGK